MDFTNSTVDFAAADLSDDISAGLALDSSMYGQQVLASYLSYHADVDEAVHPSSGTGITKPVLAALQEQVRLRAAGFSVSIEQDLRGLVGLLLQRKDHCQRVIQRTADRHSADSVQHSYNDRRAHHGLFAKPFMAYIRQKRMYLRR